MSRSFSLTLSVKKDAANKQRLHKKRDTSGGTRSPNTQFLREAEQRDPASGDVNQPHHNEQPGQVEPVDHDQAHGQIAQVELKVPVLFHLRYAPIIR